LLAPLATRTTTRASRVRLGGRRPAFAGFVPPADDHVPARLNFVQYAARHYFPLTNASLVVAPPSADPLPPPIDVGPPDPALVHDDLPDGRAQERFIRGVATMTSQFPEHGATNIRLLKT
jgi:hypothetical protein